MAIEGSITDVSLADICQLLAMGGKTGCLTVTDRSNFGYIYFEAGRVTHASILNRPDRLGELLVRNEAITREELSRAMETQAHEPGKRLGEILVSRGALTQEELNRYITIQIEEAVYRLFSWNQGRFHFDPDQQPDAGVVKASITVESLLLEGARRVDEWALIEGRIPTLDLVFSLERDPRDDGHMQLTEEQRKVVRLLDGSRTVREIVEESGLVEFEVAKAVYDLLEGSHLRKVGRRSSDPEEEESDRSHQHVNLGLAFYRAGMYEDAERELRKALEADPDHAEVRRRLALLAIRGGRWEEALEHLVTLTREESPAHATVRNLAYVLEELGRHEEALEALERAESLGAPPESVALQRGVVHLKAGRPGRARSHFDEFRRRSRNEPPPPFYYAYRLLAEAGGGRLDEALVVGREGLERHPGASAILVNLGVVLERRGETEAAEALYLRALAAALPPPQAHKNLGDLAYRRGDHAGARAHYERAVGIDPELGDDVYLKLGNLAYKDGDRSWALRHWRRALELNPGNEVVRTNLEVLAATPEP